MNGTELLRKLKRVASERGLTMRLLKKPGGTSHMALTLGERTTIFAKHGAGREIPTGTLHAMLRQLGLNPRDIEGK